MHIGMVFINEMEQELCQCSNFVWIYKLSFTILLQFRNYTHIALDIIVLWGLTKHKIIELMCAVFICSDVVVVKVFAAA